MTIPTNWTTKHWNYFWIAFWVMATIFFTVSFTISSLITGVDSFSPILLFISVIGARNEILHKELREQGKEKE